MSLDYSPELRRQHSHYKAIRDRLMNPAVQPKPEIKLVEKPPVILDIPHTREWLFVASAPEPATLWVSDICREVRQQFQVTRADFESPRRHVGIVEPRQVAMALAKRLTKRSLPEIGRQFGGRDHTTVLHAIRKYAPVLAEVEKTVSDGAPISAWVAAFKEQMTITPAANGRVSARKNHVKRQP